MTPDERKNFWARMGEEAKSSSAHRLSDREERIQRDWASIVNAGAVIREVVAVNHDVLVLTSEDVEFLTAVGIKSS